jgi:glycosyltransferase involved in cell wall biosynthesis
LLGKIATIAKIPPAVWRRLGLIRRERIDLVHINNSPCIAFDDWLPAARLARVPIVSHARGPYLPPGGSIARWLTRRFDAVIAISRNVAESFEASGFPRDRMHQVCDGIDLTRWTPRPADEGRRLRDAAGVPEDALLIVLVGLLRSWKGQSVALQALNALSPDVRCRLRLWIVGEASRDEEAYVSELRRCATEHGLASVVSFLGFRSDIPQLMGAADVVLHTSTVPEPFGLVVLEGLALGKPVIASRLGGPAEIIRYGEGLLFDPSRPDELAALLAELATSGSRRQELAMKGRIRASEFDVRRTVDGVVAIWNEQSRKSALRAWPTGNRRAS